MPFFMVISGYLFFTSAKKRELLELVTYKTKALLYPILMGSLVNWFLTMGIISMIRKQGFSGGVDLSSLWFLWSVLSASIVVSFCSKTSNRFIQCLLLLGGFIVAASLPCGDKNVWMLPYFIVGYLVAKKQHTSFSSKKTIHIIGILASLGFITMLFFFEKKHYIYTSGLIGGAGVLECLKIDLFRWTIGLLGSVAATWICKLLYGAKRNISFAFIESLGQDSLVVP